MNAPDRSRTAGVLYAEDFDDPPPVAPPSTPPAPTFDHGQMAAARQEGYDAGVQAGEARARDAREQATGAALTAIASAMNDADAAACRTAEHCADALSGLLLACLHRALPELCRLYGVGEARAVARAVLPGLVHEPQLTVRAAAETAAAVADEIARHDSDLADRVRIQPTPGLAPGDVKIAWADGYAKRDIGAIWRTVSASLQTAGLALPAEASLPSLPFAAACAAAPGAQAAGDAAAVRSTIGGLNKELQHAG